MIQVQSLSHKKRNLYLSPVRERDTVSYSVDPFKCIARDLPSYIAFGDVWQSIAIHRRRRWKKVNTSQCIFLKKCNPQIMPTFWKSLKPHFYTNQAVTGTNPHLKSIIAKKGIQSSFKKNPTYPEKGFRIPVVAQKDLKKKGRNRYTLRKRVFTNSPSDKGTELFLRKKDRASSLLRERNSKPHLPNTPFPSFRLGTSQNRHPIQTKNRIQQKSPMRSQTAHTALSKRKKIRGVLGKIHINSTKNNTILTLVDGKGYTKGWSCSGSLGFKNARKSTLYAAQAAAESLVSSAKTLGYTHLRLLVKGLGRGKQSSLRAVCKSGLKIVSVEDKTGIPYNGCRPSKKRRV